MPSINLVKIKLKIIIGFRMSGNNLPNGSSLKCISKYAIQKIAYFIIELMLGHRFLRVDDILQCLPE